MRRRPSAAAAVAVAAVSILVLVAGCSDDLPTQALGTSASLPIMVQGGGHGSVRITPSSVRKGVPGDLAGATVRHNDQTESKPPAGTPYFVRVSFCCDGDDTELMILPLRRAMSLRDTEGERWSPLDQVVWTSYREPCGRLDDRTAPDLRTECLIYVLPDDVEPERLEASSGDVRIAWSVP